MADAGESQASENRASVNLVDLFLNGENGIERRRTENLFKQLDERQLTEDEQAIIQQRVELQRKMFQEYERREKQRKLRELQEVCPDLDEDSARRALELCNWKEEVAAERVSSDPVFVRRVRSGAAAPVEIAPAPKSERHRSGSTKAVVGPRPRLVDPSQVGAVFVGRFKSRLGPHQISAMERQQHQQSAAAVAASRAPAAAVRRGATGSPAAAGGKGARADGRAAAVQEKAQLAVMEAAAELAQDGAAAPSAAAAAADGAAVDGGDDVGMADAGRVVEPDSAGELGCECEDGGGGHEAEEAADAETEDQELDDHEGDGPDGSDGGDGEEPNSADLSDNELHYEDDVQLPVMSPLAGKRPPQQQPHQGDQLDAREWGREAEEQGGAAAAGAAPASCGPSAGLKQPPPPPLPFPLLAAAMDEDEVSSPARGLQLKAAELAAANTTAPPAAATNGTTVTSARPRRATADLAAALRHAGPGGDGEAATQSEAETASDGGDSDFELGSGGRHRRGGGAAAHGDNVPTTSGSDVDLEEEDSDDFVVAGSRKRRPAAGARRQQQAQRKRAASGSSGAAAAPTRAARSRRGVAAAPGAAAIAMASGAAAANAAAAVAVAADAAADAAGPSGCIGSEATMEAEAGTSDGGAGGPSGVQALPPAMATAGGSGRCDEADSEATVTEDESPGVRGKRQPKGKKGRGERAGAKGAKGGGGAAGGGPSGGGGGAGGGAAISASGHTCRGRVKQKGVKRADLLAVGTLIARPGWYNAGYIFPAGFRAQTLFRSSVDLDSLTLHTCEILGDSGQYWPAPTFVVTAADRPDEPLVAKSCTGCWTAVLRRINGEIEGRRAAGEDLPPPPKTAIAGPEYFGLNQPEICAAIEALDPDKKCSTYWDGKVDREAARGGQTVPSRGGGGRGASGSSAGGVAAASGGGAAAAGTGGTASRPPRGAPRPTSNGGGGGKGRRGGRRTSGADDDDDDAAAAAGGGGEGEEDPEETYAGNRWSAVTRAERYRKRCEDAGEDAAALLEQSLRDNPLPGFLDPITLEPVFNPAISPYGHVMGLATWKAVLAEHGRCPFTKQQLNAEALTVLTKNNIERFRSRIIQQ